VFVARVLTTTGARFQPLSQQLCQNWWKGQSWGCHQGALGLAGTPHSSCFHDQRPPPLCLAWLLSTSIYISASRSALCLFKDAVFRLLGSRFYCPCRVLMPSVSPNSHCSYSTESPTRPHEMAAGRPSQTICTRPFRDLSAVVRPTSIKHHYSFRNYADFRQSDSAIPHLSLIQWYETYPAAF
jgi:hypothetical protein